MFVDLFFVCFFFYKNIDGFDFLFVSEKGKKKLRYLHFTSMVGLSRPISAQEIAQLLEE